MSYMQGVIFVDQVSKIPKVEHYAIMENTSVYIPGDERSRTNPGHGYPETTEYFIRYMAIIDKADVMLYLSKETPEKRRNLRILKVKPAVLVEGFTLIDDVL